METTNLDGMIGPSSSNSLMTDQVIIKSEPMDFEWLCVVLETNAKELSKVESANELIKTESKLKNQNEIEKHLNVLFSFENPTLPKRKCSYSIPKMLLMERAKTGFYCRRMGSQYNKSLK